MDEVYTLSTENKKFRIYEEEVKINSRKQFVKYIFSNFFKEYIFPRLTGGFYIISENCENSRNQKPTVLYLKGKKLLYLPLHQNHYDAYINKPILILENFTSKNLFLSRIKKFAFFKNLDFLKSFSEYEKDFKIQQTIILETLIFENNYILKKTNFLESGKIDTVVKLYDSTKFIGFLPCLDKSFKPVTEGEFGIIKSWSTYILPEIQDLDIALFLGRSNLYLIPISFCDKEFYLFKGIKQYVVQDYKKYKNLDFYKWIEKKDPVLYNLISFDREIKDCFNAIKVLNVDFITTVLQIVIDHTRLIKKKFYSFNKDF